jgi:hypothetical protein
LNGIAAYCKPENKVSLSSWRCPPPYSISAD